MKQKLQGLLLGYIRENNPGLFKQLQEDDGLHAWIMEKIAEVELVLNASMPSPTEKDFMDLMAVDLHPSRFRFVRDLFETEFTDMYEQMRKAGTLQYELLSMVALCHHLFDEMPFEEGIDNPQLDHAVACVMGEYLQIEV